MDHSRLIECGGFYFIHNFDSGNLGHVERVPTELIASTLNPKTNLPETPDYEFNLWTRPDCAGTEFENSNRTWFYFGIQANDPNVLVRLNLINLNKQGKMYNQGMAPVTRTLPGKPQWERIKDRPVHSMDDNTFTLTFKFRTPDNIKATTFFAFTYPFSFAELQIALNSIDMRMLPLPIAPALDDIYYYRECLVYSLEGRRVDLITITSHHGITNEREERLKYLFPENKERPFKFQNKKVIFISARVHPGETPSSFVFNGFLNLMLTKNDPVAIQLRKLYVFKMIPFLNPDGVARGHYRTDTRGVNLNRVYLNPSLNHHPSVFASRSLIRYYHFGCEKDDNCDDAKSFTSRSIQNIGENVELSDVKKKKTQNTKGAEYLKRDKEREVQHVTVNKSASTAKHTSCSDGSKEAKVSNEAANLVNQVYDMKLQEKPSVLSDASCITSDSTVLNDSVLQSCLGSTVHLSTSEELNLQGNNPLRPLRDTLKNSISLLMESTSFAGDNQIGEQDTQMTNVRIGWCQECKRSVAALEETMPGYASTVPGYSSSVIQSASSTQLNIESYGELQKEKCESKDSKIKEVDTTDKNTIFFCTNCFKRYFITESNEEVKIGETTSTASVAVSAGDGNEVRGDPNILDRVTDSKGDAVFSTPTFIESSTKDDYFYQQTPSKEDKSKHGPNRTVKKKPVVGHNSPVPAKTTYKEPESGLYLYIDLHGHASKKGIFMYGNHFDDLDSCVECMLLPRIMSLNNLHFHFSSCNFTERNMYLKDRRDGMSREGSGRVAVLKATGLVRSYTLECNYNTGRLVNVLPPTIKDGGGTTSSGNTPNPPKYTPHIFEEVKWCRPKNPRFFKEIDPAKVGRSLGASILDLTGQHPNSRIPASEHHNLSSVRDWLRAHTRSMRPQLTMSRLRPKTSSPSRVPLYARSKAKVTDERKENTYVGAKTDSDRKRSPPLLIQRSGHDMINMSVKFVKKTEPVKTSSRIRYLTENEPKPKTLTSKRRNILAIRKPNSSKTQVGGVVKTKISRRSVDDTESPRASVLSAKLSKRNYTRSIRRTESNRCRAMASSSSEDMIEGSWEEVTEGTVLGASSALQSDSTTGKRRPFPNPSPARLKKIRLKAGL